MNYVPNDVECHLEKFVENKKKINPNPRHYELSEDFIFVEQEWGSLFYKHIGKRTRSEAKNLCSSAGPSVHLPIPRFYEEQEFYKTHFGDENLWLDLTFDFDTWPDQDVFMNDVGQWDWTNETVLFDAVCIYDIIPDESCSKCQNESFCRYKDKAW